jgi:prefoldin beta subunit
MNADKDKMKIDKGTEEKIREMQMTDQTLQNIVLQKQSFESELNEINESMKELEISEDEVYKISGHIMIKSSKENLKKDLEDKKELINARMKSIEKQEKELEKRLDNLKKEIS